jgi:hypothetical protein
MSIEMLLQEEPSLNLNKRSLMKQLRKRSLSRNAKNYLYKRLTNIDKKLKLIEDHRK